MLLEFSAKVVELRVVIKQSHPETTIDQSAREGYHLPLRASRAQGIDDQQNTE